MIATATRNPTVDELFDLSPVGLLVCQAVREKTAEGQFGRIIDFQGTRVNEAAARLLGLSREQILSYSFLEIQTGAQESGLFDSYVTVVETGTPLTSEVFLNGHWYSGSTVQAGDGIMVSFINIDRAQQAFKNEAEARALLQGVFDASPWAITYLEPVLGKRNEVLDFVFKMANAASVQIGKRPLSELLGRTMLDLYPHTRTTGLFDQYVSVWETGKPFETELEYVAEAEGIQSWSRIQAVRQAQGLVITTMDVTESKFGQSVVQAQSELVRNLLDGSLAQVAAYEAVRDATGDVVDLRYIAVNQQVEEATRRSSAELIGKNLCDLFPVVRTSGLFDRWKAIVTTGQPDRFEWHYQREGYEGWFDCSGVRHGDGLIQTYYDITDRKQAELELARQANMLQEILDGVPAHLFISEAVRTPDGALQDFRIVGVNARAMQAHGMSEVVGKLASELFPEDRTNGVFDRYRKALETGEMQRFEWPFGQSPQPGWIEVQLIPFGTDRIIASAIDITSLKEAQLAQQHHVELLQGVMNASQSYICYCEPVRDSNGTITDFVFLQANEAVSQMVGLSADALKGRRMGELFPGVKKSGLFEIYAGLIETEQSKTFEFCYDPNPIESWFLITARPLAQGFVLSFIDITNQKHAELEKQRQAEFLQSIIDNAQTGIVLFDTMRDEAGQVVDFRYRISNVANANAIAIPNERLLGQTIQQIFPAITQSDFYHRLRQAAETGEPQRFEHYTKQDDQDRWGDVSIVRLANDSVLFTFLDVTTLKSAQLKQQQQSEILDGVLNNTASGIIHWEAVRDKSGQLVDFRTRLFNRAAAETGGLTEAELRSQTLRELSPDGLFEQYREVLETGKPLRVEHYFREVDGWFDLTAAKLGDGLVVCFNDISLVRQNVIERQRHAEVLEALLDGAINGIWALEARRNTNGQIEDFIITAANRAAADILGRPLHELVGVPLLTAYPNSKRMGYFQHYVAALDTGLPQRFVSGYHDDGLDTWFDVSAVRQTADRLVVTFIDVSEARRAHQALVGESALFQTLSSHIPEKGVLVIDHSGRILFANGELPRIFHTTDRNLLPKRRLSEVLQPALRAEILDALRQALKGRPSQVSTQIGDQFYKVYYGPVENTEQQVVMAMATFRNVTSDRLYELQLKASNENLERFAYVASHDLQEPLRKIQAFGDMLYRKQADRLDTTSVGYIRRMQSAADRMMSLIGDLLAYSRVSSTPPSFEKVALSAVVRAVRNDLDLVIQEKKASLRIDALPNLTGDGTQLRQLFQNLISNALKFSRPDVPPVIELKHRIIASTDLPSDSGLPAWGTYHEICVIDNGIGFETEYAERIFEAFQRLHGRSEYPGTGIGLAIVRKVVEKHRGAILVESTPGQGSAFRVFLPVSE